jgi:hypothetical protein
MYFPVVWDFENRTFQPFDGTRGLLFIFEYFVLGWGMTVSTLFVAWFIAFFPWSTNSLNWFYDKFSR